MTNVEFITGCLTALNTAVIFFMWLSDKRGEKLDKLEKMAEALRDEQKEMIRKLTFLEVCHLYSRPIEIPLVDKERVVGNRNTQTNGHNPRSLAAKEMWKRRKAKQIEKKDEE